MKKCQLLEMRFIMLVIVTVVVSVFTSPVQAVQLNNLVNEVLYVAGPDVSVSNHAFSNSRDGWVYIANEGSQMVTLTKDAVPESVFLETEYDGAYETMRYLEAGSYQVSAALAEELVVREVAETIFCSYPGHGRLFESWNRGGGSARRRRDVYKHVNTLWSWNGDTSNDPYYNYWKDTGRHWMAHANTDVTTYTTVAAIEDFIKATDGFKADPNEYFAGTLIDEFGINHGNYDLWAQAILNVRATVGYENKVVYIFCGGELVNDNNGQALVSALMSTGGAAVIEIYMGEEPTEALADAAIQNEITEIVAAWKTAVPGSEEHLIFCTMPADALDYMVDDHPNVNYKKFLDKQLHAFATHASCDGVRGYGAWTLQYASPEMARYLAQLWRHYGIEGQTTAFCNENYILDYVLDGDFETQSATHWTVMGTTAFETTLNYGGHQGRRYSHQTFQGDTNLKMAKSVAAANTFSQTINNLTPGQLYSFRMITTDYDTRYDTETAGEKHIINVSISDAVIKESLTMPYGANTGGLGVSMVENLHWRVFQAEASKATLTVSDWKEGSTPPAGVEIGQALVYNYIQVQPYFGADPIGPIVHQLEHHLNIF